MVLDLGVSSMQLDQAERGFSFMKDGPLDMRMSQEGPTAADLVNDTPEDELADILFLYGEERASRRIARAIGGRGPRRAIETTLRAGRYHRKMPAAPQAGAGPSRHPQFSGAPHRGER